MPELRLYRGFWHLLRPFLRPLLFVRKLQKKETSVSINHRFALFEIEAKTQTRIWLHGASVGESLIGLNIAAHLRKINPQLQFVFTCQTQAGAQIIASRKNEADLFFFAPLDHPSICEKYIDLIDPDLCVFVEGEIWPNLISKLAQRKIKIALVNARMTNKSITNWSKRKGAAINSFERFDFIHAANKPTFNFLKPLNKNLCQSISNLKYSAAPLVFDAQEIENLRAQTINRKIWLCASSHEGEEEIIIEAHKNILDKYENALLIIAPRHLKRAQNIASNCQALGIKPKYKSEGGNIEQDDNVFIWDAMGQMGSFYNLGEFSLIGGSLIPGIGGHNPIEPAQLNCAILTGPFFHNFSDVFGDLIAKSGAIEIAANSQAICDIVLKIFEGRINIVTMKSRAIEFVNDQQNVLNEIDENILSLVKGQ